MPIADRVLDSFRALPESKSLGKVLGDAVGVQFLVFVERLAVFHTVHHPQRAAFRRGLVDPVTVRRRDPVALCGPDHQHRVVDSGHGLLWGYSVNIYVVEALGHNGGGGLEQRREPPWERSSERSFVFDQFVRACERTVEERAP